MKAFRLFAQHILNPLHLFCRLREWGLSDHFARRMCQAYERGVYRFIL